MLFQKLIHLTFDNNYLPSTIVSNSTTVATYAFNGVNAPTTKTLGNTVSLNIEYNNRYQIKKHDWKLNGNTIAGYNYGHDSVGNRIWSENLVTSNKSELFVFDNADRLTSFKTGTLNGSKTAIITPIYTQDWSLDSIGNWAGFNDNGTNSTNVFSDTHAMTEFKGVIQTFDNNGNLIFDGVRAFKYDAFNRIIEVKIGTIILAEYQYDAFNRRVVKKADADLNIDSNETNRTYQSKKIATSDLLKIPFKTLSFPESFFSFFLQFQIKSLNQLLYVTLAPDALSDSIAFHQD